MATRSLLARAVLGLAFLLAVVGLAIFLPAGTIHYPEGWALLAVFGTLNVVITWDLHRRDPALLERRTRGGPTAERRPRQKLSQAIASAAFLACFLLPALDHRVHGSRLPWPAVVGGDLVVALGQLVVFLTFRENSFASATVEVAAEQRVIETGP